MNERTKAIIDAERMFGIEVKLTVWVLIFDGRHQVEDYVFKSEEELKEFLYDYVVENWNYEYDDNDVPEFPLPKDKEEAVYQYFDENDVESYQYEAHTLVYSMTELAQMGVV